MICVFIIITPLLQLVSFMLKPLIIGKIWRGELSKKKDFKDENGHPCHACQVSVESLETFLGNVLEMGGG